MAVLTLSRAMGSQGDYIAAEVAKALGYYFVDKAFIGKILQQYGLIEFGKEYDRLPGFWERFDAQKEDRRKMMGDMLGSVIQAMARRGNVVILGRGAFGVLHGMDDVLNVRIQASNEFRVRQIIEQYHVSLDEAEARIKQADKIQSLFIQEFYGELADSPDAFDLQINTDKLDPDFLVKLLVDTMKQLEITTKDRLFTTGQIEVDDVLASAIDVELR